MGEQGIVVVLCVRGCMSNLLSVENFLIVTMEGVEGFGCSGHRRFQGFLFLNNKSEGFWLLKNKLYGALKINRRVSWLPKKSWFWGTN